MASTHISFFKDNLLSILTHEELIVAPTHLLFNGIVDTSLNQKKIAVTVDHLPKDQDKT